MNKLYTILALIFVLFAASGYAASVSVVSGTVTDNSNAPVAGANVDVTCTHNSVDTVKNVITGSDGKYYAFFSVGQCDSGDAVKVHVTYGDQSGDGNGSVNFSEICRINIGLVDVQIPEFGVIAAAVALVGAVGIIAYRRK